MEEYEKSEADVIRKKAKELEEQHRAEQADYRSGLRKNWSKKHNIEKPLTIELLEEKTGISLSTIKRFEKGDNVIPEYANIFAVFYEVDVESFHISEATKRKILGWELTRMGAQKLIAVLECFIAVLYVINQATNRCILGEKYRIILGVVSILGYCFVLSCLSCIRTVIVEENERKNFAKVQGFPAETLILEMVGMIELFILFNW